MVSMEDIDQVTDAIKGTRAKNKYLENQAILDHIKKTATNIDHSHINEITKTILEKQRIYDKLSKKGTSYIMEINENSENNTDNPNNVQTTNVDNSQEHATNINFFCNPEFSRSR